MAVRGTVDAGAGGSLVTSVTGTANQITASPTSGAVVLTLATAPIFRATRITSAFTVTSGTVTKVQLNSVPIDSINGWDAVNFWYKPTVAGTYEVSGSVYGSGTTVTAVEAAISKNGTSGSGGVEVCDNSNIGLATAANQGVTLPASFVVMNGTTDTLELDATVTGTGTTAVAAVRSTSQMCIRWVGP